MRFFMKFYVCLQCGLKKFFFKKFPRKAACKLFFQSQQRCSFDKISFLRFSLLFPLRQEHCICFGIEKRFASYMWPPLPRHTYNIYFHLNLLKLPTTTICKIYLPVNKEFTT